MGLLSKIKNSITGGWAELSLAYDLGTRGEGLPFRIDINVKEQDIDVNEVYLLLECREVVDIPEFSVRDQDDIGDIDYLHVHAAHTLFSNRYAVGPTQTLAARETHSLEGIVELPTDLPPSFSGRHAHVEWRLFAGLDMKGNDPDSGWHEVPVS